MNYIHIMQILLLGLLVLLILIGQIYKIITYKMSESFDMINKQKHQNEYHAKSIRYYNSLGDKAFQNTISEMEKNETVDNFVRLDSNNVLVETFHGSSRKDTVDKVETCRSLTTCEQLDEQPSCGYCATTNKFDFDDGSGISPNVCPVSEEMAVYGENYNTVTGSSHAPDKKRGNQWAKTKYDCLKVKRQNTCDKIKTCSGMLKGTEAGDMCGWCPSDSKAKVKTDGKKALLKYDGSGDKELNSKISSDKCPDLGMSDPFDASAKPLFSELTQAGTCSVCEQPTGDPSQAKGSTGSHSRECLQSLWEAAYIDTSGVYNVTCTTDFDDSKTADAGHWLNARGPYYMIASNMRNNLKRPIADFMKKHDELNAIGDNHWKIKGGKYRRKFEIDNAKSGEASVDKLWKKCFGTNSKSPVKMDN